MFLSWLPGIGKYMRKTVKVTIKFRLYATAISIFVLLVVIGLITNFYVRNAFTYNSYLQITLEISHMELQLRKAEKDFLLYEAINSDFFETKESIYIDQFGDLQKQIQKKIENLRKKSFVRKLELDTDLQKLNESFTEYQVTFNKLTEVIMRKGFKDHGLVGAMRDKIHDVENQLKSLNDPQMQVHMLMLRRHEKDYLLRKDLKYRQEFTNELKTFQAYLETKNGDPLIKKLSTELREYNALFMSVIEADIVIGLDEKSGLAKDMNQTTHGIETNLEEIRDVIDSRSTKKINQAITALFIVSVLLSLGIVLILLQVSNHVVEYIKFLQKYITRLGNGELPERIIPKKDDEIAEMIHSINRLTENLRNTRNFAIEVGNGNLETQVNVFDNKGDLGGSLVEMRNRLYQVAREREQNIVEAERRSWITEGIAKFADILRQNNDNMDEFAYNVLSNLINYLGMNQGGLFIINEDKPDEIYFELKAAIAYGRRKFQKKRITIGEDLVGQAIQEKRLILLREIPDNYLFITSGLGQATPKFILVMPLMLHEQVMGVVEMAAFEEPEEYRIEFLNRVAKDIATTIGTVKINQKTAKLLETSRLQAEELQAQEEIFRNNIQELEKAQALAHEKSIEIEAVVKALNSTFMVVEYDLKGSILEANEAYLKFFGLQRHEAIGKNHGDFTIMDRYSDEYREFWSDLKKGHPKIFLQDVVLPNGNKVYLSMTYTPVYSEDGDPPYKIIAIALDVTEIKVREDKLRMQQEQIFSQREEILQNLEEMKAMQEDYEKREKDLKNKYKETKKELKALRYKLGLPPEPDEEEEK